MSEPDSVIPSLQRMIRLHENRYAGTGLISHAEYQLFLDAMREEGKYYQPDHWDEYTFPVGQEHWPIVGIGPSDAVVFCDWLTQREGGEWRYRLPNLREVDYLPPHEPIPEGTYAGYWTMGYWMPADLDHGFVRVGPPAPRLTIEKLCERHVHNPDLASVLNSFPAMGTALRDYLNRERAFAFTDEVFSVHNRFLMDDMVFYDPLKLTLNRDLDVARAHVLGLDLDITHALDNDPTRTLIRYRARTRARANILERFLHRFLYYIVTPGAQFYAGFDWYCDLLTMLETLRERREGGLPAFEGIRIVREKVMAEG